MNPLINENRARPRRARAQAALLFAAALSGALLRPAAAQAGPTGGEIRIAVADRALSEPPRLARIRRQIAGAAGALCPSGGLESLYREAGRRCRERAIANAERQLEARLSTRLAARADR